MTGNNGTSPSITSGPSSSINKKFTRCRFGTSYTIYFCLFSESSTKSIDRSELERDDTIMPSIVVAIFAATIAVWNRMHQKEKVQNRGCCNCNHSETILRFVCSFSKTSRSKKLAYNIQRSWRTRGICDKACRSDNARTV